LVAAPNFIQLNDGWNAEPNAPNPDVQVSGSVVELSFRDAASRGRVVLQFENCRQWRLGETNDEGWYMGQCRYSRVAPRWGEFYELTGEDGLLPKPRDWDMVPGDGDRHFLFYLRDETFECLASGWTRRDRTGWWRLFEKGPAKPTPLAK
jgi:hypothetical protein